MKKVKITAMILAVIICAAALCACGEEKSDIPKGMIELGGEFNDYRLFIPDDWTPDLSTGFVSAHASDGSNVSVQVMAVSGIYSSTTEDYIIKIGDLTYNGISDYFDKDFFPKLTSTFKDITLKEQYVKNQTFGGDTRACKYVYTITSSGQTYNIMQILTPHGGEIYIFTYTAMEANYSSHLDEVSDITGNFLFK